MKNRTILGALAMSAASLVLVLAASTQASAQECEYFTGHTTGSKGVTWSTVVGSGFPPPAYFTFENLQGSDLEVDDMSGDHELYFPWYPVGSQPSMLSIVAYRNGAFPTYFSAEVRLMAGGGKVTAYDSAGHVIWAQNYSNGVHSVRISGVGPIAEVIVEGGDNEDWIDDVCID